MDPTISVIIPTHYRNDLLPEAIESVLEQDYEPVELIVVDDSGEGHARPVLEEYEEGIDKPILHEDNEGWAAANTTGIEASSGEYIQFLDDDDRLLPGKLTKTAEVLQENPDVGVSYCGVRWGEEVRLPKPEVSGDFLEEAMLFQTFPLWTGSMLMEREVLLDCMPLAGMGDDDLDIELGDTDLKIELAKRTNANYVDECLVFYRRGENKLWTGLRKFRKVKQNIHHQEELYAQHPEIRRSVLSTWYERQGNNWLERRMWSPRAIACFAKAAYYADDNRFPKSVEAVASILGRPGLHTARRVRDVAIGKPTGGAQPEDT
jgi:glycosyltransferase involved in cell wall biosynthesis